MILDALAIVILGSFITLIIKLIHIIVIEQLVTFEEFVLVILFIIFLILVNWSIYHLLGITKVNT